MPHLLVLGSGWVGGAVAAAARAHPGVRSVHAVDPPFEPALCARDAAATDALRALVADRGVTAVLNACGRVQGGPDELTDANEHFAQWCCDALAGTGVRLVHVGSASEYGDPGTAEPVDESTPARPVGPYATTKAAGTEHVLGAASSGRLDACVARVFNLVGHPVPAVSPIHQWLTDLLALGPAGGEVEVWWPPTTRDFVMVEDAATALVELAVHEAPPRLVNVCSGTPLRFGEIVEALASALGVPAAVRSADRPGIEAVVGDPTLLRATLGWVPQMSAQLLAARATGAAPPGGAPTATR